MSILLRSARALLRRLPALVCVGIPLALGCQHAPPPQAPLMIPVVAQPWGPAQRISEEPAEHGFCLIQDRLERWHLILGAEGKGAPSRMPHAVSDRIGQPFRAVKPIDAGTIPQATRTRAPFAVYKDPSLAMLFYNHETEVSLPAIRVLRTETALMDGWAPLDAKGLKEKNIVIEEPGARDVCILQDVRKGKYLMYYAGGTQGDRILCRESGDLLTWGAPRVVLTAPADDPVLETPAVVIRQGLYYLFTSSQDYSQLSVHVSHDPFSFGDARLDRLATIPGHAARVISVGEQDYIACASIASTPQPTPRGYDLKGIYLQALQWTPAESLLPAEAYAAHQIRINPKK